MKWQWWLAIVVGGLALVLGFWLVSASWRNKQTFLSPQGAWEFVAKPLQKYSFPSLKQQVFSGSAINVDANWIFTYKAEGKTISGKINLPEGNPPESGWPVVILIRGFVEPEIYASGVGSQRVGEFLASNGFITLAPDFLGFGLSDPPPNNVLEERFLRPVAVLELIASVASLPQANPNKIFIWGHSNGGQIALSVLEISGASYPTSLWAPVSKPFPYSILYYTDEFEDYGKALRKVVAGFEAIYNADEFSIHHYYDWINAPIHIHQGTADEAVPLTWSQALAETLEAKGEEVILYVYPQADHNLLDGWDTAVQRDLNWFKSQL